MKRVMSPGVLKQPPESVENPETAAANALPQSVLTIDIGTVNTRACLFEIRAGKYRFIGSASDRTTHLNHERSEFVGIAAAVRKLEKNVKKRILDADGNFILPMATDFSGIDQAAASYTCIADPAIAIFGLSEAGSLPALRSLCARLGTTPILECALDDGHSTAKQLDRLTAAAPRIIVFAGGTENGARRAVYRIGETILLYCKSLTREQRPLLLFLGNSETRVEIERVFAKISDIAFGSNVMETEPGDEPALNCLLKTIRKDASLRAPGFETLRKQTNASFIPGEFAFGRSVRLLSRLIRKHQVVLGVNIGADRTLIAQAMDLRLKLKTVPIGLGKTLPGILSETDAESIRAHIDFQIRTGEIRDYILNKSLYPELVPANRYAAEIEIALKEELIRIALFRSGFLSLPPSGRLSAVLLTGSGLRNVEDPGASLRAAMNAIRPYGAIDYLLDMNGLAAVIGTVMHVNPKLAADIMDSSTYLNLGKVIRPRVLDRSLWTRKNAAPMRISIQNTGGDKKEYLIPFGEIYRIPLNYGQNYRLEWLSIPRGVDTPGIQPFLPFGFKSGSFGLIFDLRGERGTDKKDDRAAEIERLRLEKKQLGDWRIGEGGRLDG